MTMYMLEIAEPYIVKTELTKNRTCQSYRWKQVALCEAIEPLEQIMGKYHRIINWDTLEVIKQTYTY